MKTDRRTVVFGAAAVAALGSSLAVQQRARANAGPAGAGLETTNAALNDIGAQSIQPPHTPSPFQPSPQYLAALALILRDLTPLAERVTVDIPETAENGNIVPYTLSVDSPMTDEQRITRLYLLSTLNPQALVASFRFGAHSPSATVTGRLRLAKTQDVVALAETNGGTFLIGRRMVNVLIGGCGSD